MKLIQQPTNNTCSQACLSMATGKPVDEIINEIDGPMDTRQIVKYLVENKIFPSNVNVILGHTCFPYQGIYIACVPSLNTIDDLHCIILEVVDDKIFIHDPSKRNAYDRAHMINGRPITLVEVYYLDYELLK